MRVSPKPLVHENTRGSDLTDPHKRKSEFPVKLVENPGISTDAWKEGSIPSQSYPDIDKDLF